MMSPMEVNTCLGLANIALGTVEAEDTLTEHSINKMREALATAQFYLMEMCMETLAKELGNE